MKKINLFFLTSFAFINLNAQTTWADDAAEVLYNNCTSCHNPNGIAPNSFMTYTDASTYSSLIQAYVQTNVMPPWTADTSYQHFSQERVLTQTERDILLNWVADGAVSGDLNQAPPPPVYNGSQVLPGNPDLVINAPNYMSKATQFSDDYVCFVLPSGLLQDRKVKAFEVIPGNRETVHHCLVFTDPANIAVTDTVGGNCGGPSSGDLMGGYTPGASPIIFPSTDNFSSGMIMEAGSNIVLAMHYPEGSFGTFDQTKVNFYFYDEPVTGFREIFAKPLIQNWTFSIAPDTYDSVEVTFSGIIGNYTLLSVFPHMHLVGEYIESYATTIANDTIPFIKIPHWDFEWQDFYWFEYMKKIPFGSQIHGKGIYNNTDSNPHNPHNPPQTITAGLNTSDEMFLIYYHYMQYQPGDELINVDSLTTLFLSQQEYEFITDDFEVRTTPNPFTEQTTISYGLSEPAFVSLFIYDIQGKLINKLVQGQQFPGEYNAIWSGRSDSGSAVSPGIYFYSMRVGDQNYSGKLIKQN